MKNNFCQKGFIQISVLITIIAGVMLVSGVGYFGIKTFETYRVKQEEKIKVGRELILAQQQQLDETTKEAGLLKQESQDTIKKLQEETSKRLDIIQRDATNKINDIQKRSEEELSKQKEKAEAQNTKNDSAAIISHWRQLIAYVECDFRYSDTGQLYLKSSGSGTVMRYALKSDIITVLTNKHVITDDNGFIASSCKVYFPDINSSFTSTNITTAFTKVDLGSIKIIDPNDNLKSLTSAQINLCRQKPDLGDEVVILGYPGIGSNNNITATNGIISGDDGTYYVTSAKVEQGNSGGAAIIVKDSCFLGVPTYAITGQVESLARILDVWGLLGSPIQTWELLGISTDGLGELTGYVVAKEKENDANSNSWFIRDPMINNYWKGCNSSSIFGKGPLDLSGVKITLYNSGFSETVGLSTCNDGGAWYIISNIPPGLYNVKLDVPSGWKQPIINKNPSTFMIDPIHDSVWFTIVKK